MRTRTLVTTADVFYAIYEPVYNAPGGTDYDVWNTWSLDVDSIFWCSGTPPVGGPAYRSLTDALGGAIATARVIGFTFNQGTGNNGWETLVDAFSYFDANDAEVGFDFEPPAAAPPAPPAGPALANTGGELPVAAALGGLAVIVLGAAGILLGRRRARA